MISPKTRTGWGSPFIKNGIYSIAQNATEFVNLWLDKRKSVTKFKSRYELVYVNIKMQKVDLTNSNQKLKLSDYVIRMKVSKYILFKEHI